MEIPHDRVGSPGVQEGHVGTADGKLRTIELKRIVLLYLAARVVFRKAPGRGL